MKPPFVDPNVLVGYQTADDAGVYLLDEGTALVQSVDFFTPVVDDPFIYGQIAAANSLSDIYAMGGTPRFALSVVGFPKSGVDPDVLREILQGGVEKLAEASVAVMGGHSVQDPEIKFGYCVTGVIDPAKVRRNDTARAGDILILTKPIGTGVIATAIKFEKASSEVAAEAVENMLRLNKIAAAAASGFRVHSMTDVTGFGLLGHAFEMASSAGVTFQIEANRIPLLTGTVELAAAGMLPGGIATNRDYVGANLSWQGPKDLEPLLFDPQTSGGLLCCVHPDDASAFSRELEERGELAATIGRVGPRQETALQVTA